MKKIMKIAFVAIFAAVAGYGVYTNQKVDTMTDLMLANVEALANGESGGFCRWSRVFDSMGCQYWNCVSNGDGNICNCGDTQG